LCDEVTRHVGHKLRDDAMALLISPHLTNGHPGTDRPAPLPEPAHSNPAGSGAEYRPAISPDTGPPHSGSGQQQWKE
jgi:hypothetical protein